jgi:phytoene dehydrogenase-like protein
VATTTDAEAGKKIDRATLIASRHPSAIEGVHPDSGCSIGSSAEPTHDMACTFLASPPDFLDAHFNSDKLKAMMVAWGLHLDFAPDTAGGALLSIWNRSMQPILATQALFVRYTELSPVRFKGLWKD